MFKSNNSVFQIGSSHKVCEDYALAGDINSRPFAFLSDGCSASEHTDIGARILTQIASNILRTCEAANDFTIDILYKLVSMYAQDTLNLLHLNRPDEKGGYPMDATLLSAFINVDNELLIAIKGDGVYLLGRKDGSVDIYHLEYPSGAPNYLSYVGNEGRLANYVKLIDNAGNLADYYEFTTCRLNTDSSISNEYLAKIKISEQKQWAGHVVTFTREELKEYTYVLLLSDGVNSFYKEREENKVDYIEVLSKFLPAKNLNGEFVERLATILTRTCKKENWNHYDDFSMAGFSLTGFNDG